MFLWEKNNPALGFARAAGFCSPLCQGFLLPFVFSIVSAWWAAKSTREPGSDSCSVSVPLHVALGRVNSSSRPSTFFHLILPLRKQTEANPTLSPETLSWLVPENMQITIICPVFSFSVPHFSSLGD